MGESGTLPTSKRGPGSASNADENDRLVCVTGASGFIGTHVVRALLERGFRVRATVRSPDDPAKVAHLRALGDPGDLDIFGGDLQVPGSFDAAAHGCRYVVHTASPVMINARDPERDIVGPAVEGTRNVLDSVVRAGSVRRVVLTSSIAAVYDLERSEDHVFTESDWNESATRSDLPYPKSKVLAERAAFDFRNGLPVSKQFELTAINPTFVLGPVTARIHLRTSPGLVSELLNGKLPGLPNFLFNLVDVRDVAEAHLRAMLRPSELLAPRYICHADQLHFSEVARHLKRAFPGHRIPTRRLPDLLVYAYALFDKRLTWAYLRRALGRRIEIDNRRAQQDLNIVFRPVEDTLRETGQSMVELGFVQ